MSLKGETVAKDPKASVLKDHERHKKRLVPPLIAAMKGGYAPYSWAREIAPEYIWITLVLEKYGDHEGVEICNQLGQMASQVFGREPKPLFAAITSFSELSPDEKSALSEMLDNDTAQKITAALQPLADLCAEHPLSFLASKDFQDQKSKIDLGLILQDLYDRHSRRAVMVMSTAFYLGICQDKIVINSHLREKFERDFAHIPDYPNTEESKAAASSFRASAPMFLMRNEDEERAKVHEDWLEFFWSKVSRHGDCISETTIEDEGAAPEDSFGRLVFEYRAACKKELKARLVAWGFELKRIELYEVIGALLARQTTLAIEFALVPPAWNANSAPLFLRAMADVYITVAWILGEPEARAQKFVEAGLGEIKLEIAHRKQELEKLTDPEQVSQQQKFIEHLEHWLQSQRIESLVEVNLGSWAGISTRKMAEEAGCLDFYNYVYQPFSVNVHSTWPHISRANSVYCTNPSHRFHRLPAIKEMDPDIHWLYLAGKYLQKTFAKFDEVTGIVSSVDSAFELLCDGLEADTPDE